MSPEEERDNLKKCLVKHRKEGKLLVAVLYGSFAGGAPHARSDIDLAIYLKAKNMEEEIEIIDEILMSADRQVSILRLDDEDESPFVVQEALKGIHLVEPDEAALYGVYHRVLHESEGAREKREAVLGSD
jgi:predicted nucleotidyltransferase